MQLQRLCQVIMGDTVEQYLRTRITLSYLFQSCHCKFALRPGRNLLGLNFAQLRLTPLQLHLEVHAGVVAYFASHSHEGRFKVNHIMGSMTQDKLQTDAENICKCQIWYRLKKSGEVVISQGYHHTDSWDFATTNAWHGWEHESQEKMLLLTDFCGKIL